MPTKKQGEAGTQTDQQEGVFDLDNLPADFQASGGQSSYAPLPADVYQVQIMNIEIKENIFYKPEDPKSNPLNKYSTQVTLVIIDDGEFYGRRLWDNFAPVIKPTTKKGPTKAYKFVTTVLGTSMDWDSCASFASNFGKNMKEFLGRQLRVSVETVAKQDGTPKNKIASYMEAKKQLPPFDESKLEKK